MQTFSSSKTQSWLLWFLKGVLILGFLTLLTRLFNLQIIEGKYFRELAEGNRIRRVPIIAARGRIFGRGGEVLVGNREIKKKVEFDPESGYEKTDDITGATETELISEWVRDYKMGSAFAHVSGYLGEVTSEELGKIKAQCPERGPRSIGSWVGRSGLEEEYDCILSGIDGEELVEVDSSGNKIRVLGKKAPQPGSDLKTFIDYGLQEKVAELMKDKKGAVVVTDSQGEVLALYSSISFDPNVFVKKGKEKVVSDLLTDNNFPLFNRVIAGTYHPGSTYKPIVAIAALEEGKIDRDFTYEDTGQVVVKTIYGTYTYSNWYFTQYGGVEGKINLVKAITRSTDTFFYKLGEAVGVEKLGYWSSRFLLDKTTGIDLPGEISGLIPSSEWKEEVKGERWFLGNTYHMSIGQGDIAITPIGLNVAISAIARDGKLCSPKIAGEVDCSEIDINEENTELVKEGMVGACKEGGTGFTFFDFEKESHGVKVACKTGTAETDEANKPHAWFVAFGPVEKPEIVATVLVEKGGEGSYVAGPIAREIFNYWFNIIPSVSPTPAND